MPDGGQALGLFGDNSGTLRNVVVDGTVLYEGSEEICSVGGIVGINRGTVEGCRNYASVSCTLSETSGNRSILYVGGVAGANAGTVSGCQNEGTVTGDNRNTGISSRTYSGGIVGTSSSVVAYSENSQSVSCKGDSVYVGGVAGALVYSKEASARIEFCSNYGSAKVEAASSLSDAGGIVGYMGGTNREVSGSNNYGEVVATISHSDRYAKAGGIAGENESGLLRSDANSGSVTAVNTLKASCTAAGGIVGNNTSGGKVHACTNESVAAAVCEGPSGGIAGVNNRATDTAAYVYACCVNAGSPAKWIGNASGSEILSGVDTEEHADE